MGVVVVVVGVDLPLYSVVLIAAAIASPLVSAAAAAASGVGSSAPLAEGLSLHRAITRGVLAITTAEVVVAVSASVTTLVAVATSIGSSVSPIAAATAAAVVASAISIAVVSAVVPAAVAILIPPAPARPAPRCHTVSAGCLQLLLCESLFNFHLVSFDGVELDNDRLVGCVVVSEVNKAEAPLLPSLLLGYDFDLLDLAILVEVLVQVLLFDVVFQATDENLLDFGEGFWPVGVFPRHRSLHLHGVAVDVVRPGSHGCVGLLLCGVGDKAEAAGPLQLLVHDDHAVGERTELLEMRAETFVVRLHVESPDEKLAKLVSHLFLSDNTEVGDETGAASLEMAE